MTPRLRLGAVFALLTGAFTQAQPSGLVLETYLSPGNYLNPHYAIPVKDADYLFYKGDRIALDVEVHNGGTASVSIRVNSDLRDQLALVLSSPLTTNKRLTRDQARAGPSVRVRDRGGPDMSVSGDTEVVLNPEASLVIPVSLGEEAEWPDGAIHLEANVSLMCTPPCAVKPHSNVFRFEVREATSQADRMEVAYRAALRGMLAADLDAAELSLKTLDSEGITSPSALYLHARLAEQRGDRAAALTYYRATDAALRSRSNPAEIARMGTGFDDFVWNVGAQIARLTPKK